MKNLLVRSVTGVVYILMVALPIAFKLSGPYVAVFSIFILLGIREYSMLAKLNRTRPLRTILDGVFGAYLFMAVLFHVTTTVGVSVFLPYIFYLLYLLGRGVFSDRERMVQDASRTIFGQVYIALSVAAANLIAFPKGEIHDVYFSQMDSLRLLTVFIIIWTNDTFALLSGLLLGKHKLFPEVSPKKTWEGFFGGMLFSIAVALIVGACFGSGMSIVGWALLGVATSAAATFGDLFESALKRNAQVKDSGVIFPGHGGVLDRLDSAFFALPTAYIIYTIFGSI